MIKYCDLIRVPIVDCGESLFPLAGVDILLREGCIARLREASNTLKEVSPSASLVVVDGYRHPDIQARYFEEQLQRIRSISPHLEEEELLEEVQRFIAVPAVAGHPTGGAVDVTIRENGVLLDMGTAIADFSEEDKIPTFSHHITEAQWENRFLLRSIMMNAGFAPFDGEWWHFSYGDREWACYYKRSCAIYDQIAIQHGFSGDNCDNFSKKYSLDENECVL